MLAGEIMWMPLYECWKQNQDQIACIRLLFTANSLTRIRIDKEK
jgi:hypothetical protein